LGQEGYYEVTGNVEGLGFIDEFTHAYSEKQAIKQVALRLTKQKNIQIFIKEATAKITDRRASIRFAKFQ